MKMICFEGVTTPEECVERMKEHEDWSWMQWEAEWRRTGSDVDGCIAMSLMMNQ